MRIPALTALRGFEAAARLRSVSRAAHELGMTQSAVSHHIRALEAQLGQPLFRRANRGIHPTDAGHDLMLTTQESLRLLEEGLRRLDRYRNPDQLVVCAPPAFASCWLVPRLPLFRAAHPEVDLWLYVTDAAVDLSDENYHVAIARGAAREGELRLLEEALLPVAAPGLVAPPPLGPRDLLAHPLLDDEAPEGWLAWFTAQGVDVALPTPAATFSDSGLMVQAARLGQGVGLASTVLVGDALAEGALIAPWPVGLRSGLGYSLNTQPGRRAEPRIAGFLAWIEAEARRFEAETSLGAIRLMGDGRPRRRSIPRTIPA